MKPLEPLTLRDPSGRVVAVQIRYEDWLEIEKLIAANRPTNPASDLSRFAGTLKLPGDALDYQRSVRDEWRP